ncbi:hypothetical protein [Lyngbya confervoides]|uniref:DUF304 domain-containing protein n=1 Tax=Lyngbya confervoides BDU141951 TaxID=1574623 RepID=A0ABD4T174_9CYAN|nr:hypothetical protein [Lyngbya confervoides]MCM1982185.1 hypothetical protein [Lyngbya confervoides BDU141951]
MKVIQANTVRLVVKENLLGLRLISACTTLIGFYIFISFEPPVDLFGGLCIAIASLINVLSPNEICTFDKTLDCLTLHQIRGLKQRTKHYPISQIRELSLQKVQIFGTAFYQIQLQFTSGEVLPLTQSMTTDCKRPREALENIQKFLICSTRASLKS